MQAGLFTIAQRDTGEVGIFVVAPNVSEGHAERAPVSEELYFSIAPGVRAPWGVARVGRSVRWGGIVREVNADLRISAYNDRE